MKKGIGVSLPGHYLFRLKPFDGNRVRIVTKSETEILRQETSSFGYENKPETGFVLPQTILVNRKTR